MQEYTSPGAVAVDPDENLTTALWQWEAERPAHPILSYRSAGPFVDVDYGELAAKARRVAAGLMSLGLQKGDRVCVFSPTRYEYTILTYGIWAAGCVLVTIYDTSSAEQVEWIVSDSGARAIVCADAGLEGVYRERAGALGTIEHVFVLDEGGLDALIDLGRGLNDDQVLARAASVTQEDLGTLIYTSGTTGRPKGCMLTVGNYVWELRQVLDVLGELLYEGSSTLMFLPLAHSFANLVQASVVMAGNGTMAFSSGIPHLTEELPMVRPTWLFSVPRVFERVYNGAQQRAEADGKGKIFQLAADTAIAYSRQREAGSVALTTRVMHGVFDRLVYGKLRNALGGRVAHSISGGAALGERLGHFYSGIGIIVLEGYGLTETTAGSTVNSPGSVRIGTVGRPLPGASIRIADDGEVLIRGPHVFRGYWNNDQATAETFTIDGWFRSGDIGTLDDDGYLRITGRKKELIVTAGGKNVAPVILEDRLNAHPLVSQSMVVGDDRPYIAALITLDPEELPRWAERRGKAFDRTALVSDPDLVAEIEAAVAAANEAVSRAESIRRYRILADDFTMERDELTPTLKLKRRVVMDHYAEAIQALYTD
ncbi:MAG: long-chain fatty acid--CoA ligase [Acidimicrobiia bacterium]|jgi:long-chain acyl-CoA synthetase